MSEKAPVRQRIINAALAEVRAKGYSATTVDALCAKAGVTKGAFFHHFKSKEDLAIQAADFWSEMTGDFFARAAYQKLTDPLERVLGYLDFRREILKGAPPEFTCFVGTMVQEAYGTYPAIRDACRDSIFGHAAVVGRDIADAKKLYAADAKWSAESLALHIQAVLQGSFILAKANENAKVAAESISHLRRYVEMLFRGKNKNILKEAK